MFLTHKRGSETVPLALDPKSDTESATIHTAMLSCSFDWYRTLTNETIQDLKHDKRQAKMVIETMKTALITLVKAI